HCLLFMNHTTSIVASLILWTAFGLKERQDEPGNDEAIEDEIEFHQSVASMILKARKKVSLRLKHNALTDTRSADFLIEVGEKKLIIEIKAWNSSVPPQIVYELIDRLTKARKELGADLAIVVTRRSINLNALDIQQRGVQFMTRRELRNFLEFAG
ncbi:MAG: restriction endonuclease, partial [Candidatus Zixiibacteriota bacterium]